MAERKPLPGDRPVCECHGEPMCKDGYGGWRCAVRNREGMRAYRQANPEKLAEYKRAYYEANREKVRAASRAYYEANREKIKDRQRAYYEANRESEQLRNMLRGMTRARTRY